MSKEKKVKKDKNTSVKDLIAKSVFWGVLFSKLMEAYIGNCVEWFNGLSFKQQTLLIIISYCAIQLTQKILQSKTVNNIKKRVKKWMLKRTSNLTQKIKKKTVVLWKGMKLSLNNNRRR